MKMEVSTRDYTALVSNYEGMYTISLIERGGPIISGADLNETKKDFEEAMSMSLSVRNLRTLNNGVAFWMKLGKIMYKDINT